MNWSKSTTHWICMVVRTSMHYYMLITYALQYYTWILIVVLLQHLPYYSFMKAQLLCFNMVVISLNLSKNWARYTRNKKDEMKLPNAEISAHKWDWFFGFHAADYDAKHPKSQCRLWWALNFQLRQLLLIWLQQLYLVQFCLKLHKSRFITTYFPKAVYKYAM